LGMIVIYKMMFDLHTNPFACNLHVAAEAFHE
jgi:hypothetical protein